MLFQDRLKAERKRLKLTQEDMATAVGTSKSSQLNYEKGKNIPGAEYLAAISRLGVDVAYVLTGERGGIALSDEEAALLRLFRQQTAPNVRAAALEVLKKGMVLSVQQVIVSGNVASGGNGHQVKATQGRAN